MYRKIREIKFFIVVFLNMLDEEFFYDNFFSNYVCSFFLLGSHKKKSAYALNPLPPPPRLLAVFCSFAHEGRSVKSLTFLVKEHIFKQRKQTFKQVVNIKTFAFSSSKNFFKGFFTVFFLCHFHIKESSWQIMKTWDCWWKRIVWTKIF